MNQRSRSSAHQVERHSPIGDGGARLSNQRSPKPSRCRATSPPIAQACGHTVKLPGSPVAALSTLRSCSNWARLATSSCPTNSTGD